MEQDQVIRVLGSLGSGVRLDIYRLLVRQGMDGLVAGDIGSALDIPSTNLSFHLKALTQAGLLTVVPEGRFQRYRAHLTLMLDVIGYLTEECCASQRDPSSAPCAALACAPTASRRTRKAMHD